MHVRLDARVLGSVNDYCIPGRALAEDTILVWCLLFNACQIGCTSFGLCHWYCIPGRAWTEDTILIWCLTMHIHFSNTLYACLNPKLNHGRLRLDNMPIGRCTLAELKRLCPTCLRLPLITMKFGDWNIGPWQPPLLGDVNFCLKIRQCTWVLQLTPKHPTSAISMLGWAYWVYTYWHDPGRREFCLIQCAHSTYLWSLWHVVNPCILEVLTFSMHACTHMTVWTVHPIFL